MASKEHGDTMRRLNDNIGQTVTVDSRTIIVDIETGEYRREGDYEPKELVLQDVGFEIDDVSETLDSVTEFEIDYNPVVVCEGEKFKNLQKPDQFALLEEGEKTWVVPSRDVIA